jgi:foldase protein PrsA
MRLRSLALALSTMLLFGACGNLLEPAAAVVHGEKIPVDEITSAVEDFQKTQEFERLTQQGDADAITREFEQSYLSQLIRREILTPEASERGVEVTDEEVQEQLDAIQSEFVSPSAFEEALREQGLTLDQLKQLIADRALEEALRAEITADLAPTDEEIAEFYEENREQFQETEAQHILVDDKARAANISRQLQAAPKDDVVPLFKTLAQRFSTDKSNKASGGELGFFSQGQFVPEFEEGANALEIGEVSDPIKSEFGWHVIRVTDRRVRSILKVRDDIVTQLSGAEEEAAWERFVENAYRDAEVEVNPRYGEFNLATQQIEDASARTIPGAEETPRQPPAEPTATP